MFIRSEILTKAWSDYRRDQRMGLCVRRVGPFSRKHFAYCLRMAWAVVKDRAAKTAASIAIVRAIARLTCPATLSRIEEIRAELLWEQLGDRINWTAYHALQTELSTLTT